jgi:hypothetical protein
MPLTYYPFEIDLYQIGKKELRKPRTTRGHAWARSPKHLESIIKRDLKKKHGVTYVDFDLSWIDLSVLKH